MGDAASDGAPARKGGGRVAPHGVAYAVVVEVDGRRLELKEFLHDMLGGAVAGLLEGLRDVGTPRRIRIDVERR